ncbi:MAG TPA: MBL fold metallo-hydrolase [Mycobacteriales bacterium]|nr:MBL fold metallo-hydrolase [Mycobacteriales bacterium]
MLVVGFPAGPFETNCWVVAPAQGEQCVVIDPGVGAEDLLDDVLDEHKLAPVAVLLTHGHLDHVWAVAPVCGAKDIPALIHPADRGMLTDPTAGLGVPSGTPIFGRLEWAEPSDLRELSDGETLHLAGLDLAVDWAPGHTKGSVTFTAGTDFFSGDLLFAGSIGRTDLPGGSYAEILESLARIPLRLPDEMVVRPGHGPQTTIGRERRMNPFLVEIAATQAEGGALPPVTRGL